MWRAGMQRLYGCMQEESRIGVLNESTERDYRIYHWVFINCCPILASTWRALKPRYIQ